MTARRVLVTGAGGFVGANLTRKLLVAGHEVSALFRPDHTGWRLADIAGDIRALTADLTDANSVRSAVQAARPSWIFHLATHGAYSWERDARRMLDVNILGLANLLDAALTYEVERFVNTGSSSEYGVRSSAPSEDERPEPNSHYGATKAAATMYARFIGRDRRASIVTLRLYSAYGPWEDPNRLIPTMILSAMAGRWPPLVSPETARDFVYVGDVVDAYIRAATTSVEPGDVFNIGTGRQSTIREAVETARRLLPIDAEPAWGSMPGRSWDASTWVADPTRARAILDWIPRHDLESGLRETIAWFRENPAMIQYYESRIANGR